MILRYALGHFPSQTQVCHSTLHTTEDHLEENVKIPTINAIKKEWNEYSQQNKGTERAADNFYFSFLQIMNIPRAKNILDVGCGFGSLIPVAINLKKQQATYLAIDLAQKMIQNAKNNIKQNFLKYSSQLTFEQWCQKQHLSFETANGEDIICENIKFDRIICNFVLMITQNPQKMLKSFYDQAQSGCLLGVSVWGDEQKNSILKATREICKEERGQESQKRSQFHLYKKVGELAEKQGWQTVLQWQQNALIPLWDIESEGNKFGRKLDFFTNPLPENKRDAARKKIIERASSLLKSKKGMNFSAELYLFRKP